MKAQIVINEKKYTTDLSDGKIISIPVNFDGAQPNTYDVNKATSKAYEAGDFIGDTRRGGGCNFEEVSMIPHCNGTHTECVGHISFDRISVNKFVNDLLLPSALISVTPENALGSGDSYIPDFDNNDKIISRHAVESALEFADKDFLKALIIRTLPNDRTKLSRRYSAEHPAFFSSDAMKVITSFGVEHLLTDLPSIDRTFDEGKLTCHHIFWNVRSQSHDVDPETCSRNTITEMIYVPDEVKDGSYLTSIHIPDFVSDAAPSRIVLYKVEQL